MYSFSLKGDKICKMLCIFLHILYPLPWNYCSLWSTITRVSMSLIIPPGKSES